MSAHLSDDELVVWRPYCCDFCTYFQSDSLGGIMLGIFSGYLVLSVGLKSNHNVHNLFCLNSFSNL